MNSRSSAKDGGWGSWSIGSVFYVGVSALTLGFLVYSPSYYTRMEDPAIHLAARGSLFGGEPTEYLRYVNVLLGLLFKCLYDMAPDVEWYPTTMKSLLVLAGGFGFCLGHKLQGFCKASFLVLNSYLLVRLTVFMQFTQTSWYLTSIGTMGLLLFLGSKHCRSVSMLAASSFFVLVGFLYRSQMAASAVTVIAVGCSVWIYRKLQGMNLTVRRQYFSCLFLLLAISAFAHVFNAYHYKQNSDWQDFFALNKVKAMLSDYRVSLDEASVSEALTAMNWSTEQAHLADSQIICDKEMFPTAEVLSLSTKLEKKSLASLVPVGLTRMGEAFYESWPKIAVIGLAVVLPYFFVVAFTGLPHKKGLASVVSVVLPIASAFGIISGVSIYLQRMPDRVFVGYLFAMSIAMIVLMEFCGHKINRRRSVQLVFVGCIAVSTLFAAVDLWRLHSTQQARVVGERAIVRELQYILGLTKDGILAFTSFSPTRLDKISPWAYAELRFDHNRMFVLGGPCLGGQFKQKLRGLGIDNLFRYLADANSKEAYFLVNRSVASYSYDRVPAYIKSIYNPLFELKQVYGGKRYKLFKAVR